MDIFENFPTIVYEGKESKNIILKAGLIKDLIKKYKVFYPYSVKDGERPDTIAYDYYGDSSYEWLVCLPNNIIDIHSEWVKSYSEFYRYMQEKYTDVNATKNIILHYEYTGLSTDSQLDIDRISWKMSVKTFNTISSEEKSGWSPVYVYDYEDRLNEEKREIILLSNQYLGQIDREVRELFV